MKGTPPVAVPASVAEEAERTLKLLDRAVDRISEFKFPELRANIPDPAEFDDDDDEDEQFVTFTCPWCEADIDETSLIHVDGTTRKTYGMEWDSSEDRTVVFDYDEGETDQWQGLYLTCGNCTKPVSLPEEFDTEAYSY